MLLVVLNKMLRKILSLVSNFEKDSKKKEYRKAAASQGTLGENSTKESIPSVSTRSTQAKIPDPWFN